MVIVRIGSVTSYTDQPSCGVSMQIEGHALLIFQFPRIHMGETNHGVIYQYNDKLSVFRRRRPRL